MKAFSLSTWTFFRNIADNRYTLWLLSVSLFVCLLGVESIPPQVHSLDFKNYLSLLQISKEGGNPYVDTPFLNYPPAWVHVLQGLELFGQATTLPIEKLLRVLWAISFIGIILITYRILLGTNQARTAFVITLFGLSLNPAMWVLVFIHGSFDPLVSFLMLFFIYLLLKLSQQFSVKSWLVCSLSLGIAILLKTVPILLFPLLLMPTLKCNWRLRMFGVCLALGPAVIGIGILYLLYPAATITNVLSYASVPGYFGLTGLTRIFGFGAAFDTYIKALFIGSVIMLGAWHMLRWHFYSYSPRSEITRFSFLIFLLVFVFGPGFGTQYLIWLIPLALLNLGSYSCRTLRELVPTVCLFLVTLLTITFEYSHYSVLSGKLPLMLGLTGEQQIMSPHAATIRRLPLFMCCVWLCMREMQNALKLRQVS